MSAFAPRWRTRTRWMLAVLFVGAGALHFVAPNVYLPLMPPYLPAPLTLVYLSGVAEIAGGIGLLLLSTRRWAGLGLIAMLGVFLLVHVHTALNPADYVDFAPAWALWVRIPLQFAFMALIWWATQPRANASR
ncbi:MAG: hypothetical protein AAGG50_13865 [Bacteroidota bacterium]